MVETKFSNNVLTAYLSGEIDHDSAAQIRVRVDGMAQELKPGLLCLDFGGVSFMDSSGIAIVIHTLRAMEELEGEVWLSNIPPQPMKVLRAAGIEKLVRLGAERSPA